MRFDFPCLWVLWPATVVITLCTACHTLVFDAVTAVDTEATDGTDSDSTVPDTDTPSDNDTDDTEDTAPDPPFDIPEAIPACASLRPDTGAVGDLRPFVVGDGTPDSCNESTLRNAVTLLNENGGGFISFDCGVHQVTVSLLQPLTVSAGVTFYLDGGGRVTLDGRNTTRILSADYDVQMVLRNTAFTRGLAADAGNGGAILFADGGTYGSLTVSGCLFYRNVSEQGRGGALFTEELQTVHIYRSVFTENYGAYGGAIFVWGKNLLISDSQFTGNGVFGEGGAVNYDGYSYVSGTERLAVCGSRFRHNTAVHHGSALKAYMYEDNVAEYRHCEFLGNENTSDGTSGNGYGALYHHGAPMELVNSSFIDNLTGTSAAGLYLDAEGTAEVVNCTFAGNRSLGDGSFGGAIFHTEDSAGTYRNCTFAGNRASTGSAIYRSGAPLTIHNSIFADNLASADDTTPTACFMTHDGDNNLQWAAGWDADDQTPCATGTTFVDPLLSAAQDNGGVVFTCAIDLLSPAVGMGVDCPDDDGRGFARDDDCDAGAFEAGALDQRTISDR